MEVRFESGRVGGTASIEDGELSLIGEVNIRDVVVTTKPELREGWWRLRSAPAKSVSGESVSLTIETPDIVKPKVPLELTVPCKDTLLSRAELPSRSGKQVFLRDGIDVPLRSSSTGPVVAQITTPSVRAPLDVLHDAIEIERRGGLVRILIEGGSMQVDGWVPSNALKAPAAILGALGGMTGPTSGTEALRCSHDVPVLVRRGGGIVRVGTIKAKAPIPANHDSSGDEIELDLEDDPACRLGRARDGLDTTPAFIRASSVADCSP